MNFNGAYMAKIGYARVSTLQQDLTEQINQLEAFGCRKIFAGKHSGNKKENQDKLDEMLNYAREGDTIVVTKIDRLARSMKQCVNILDTLRERNIDFIALQQGINTAEKSDPMTIAYMHLLSLFADMERNFIVERTQEGKRLKIAAGNLQAKGGRPPKVTSEIRQKIMSDFDKRLSIAKVAGKYLLSKATIAKLKSEYNKLKEKLNE